MGSFMLAVITVLLAPLGCGPSHNDSDRMIRVSGEGVATAPPDLATIQTGVVSRAPSATEAISKNTHAMQEVLATLKKFGVAEEDVQTTNFNMHPVYHRNENGRVL